MDYKTLPIIYQDVHHFFKDWSGRYKELIIGKEFVPPMGIVYSTETKEAYVFSPKAHSTISIQEQVRQMIKEKNGSCFLIIAQGVYTTEPNASWNESLGKPSVVNAIGVAKTGETFAKVFEVLRDENKTVCEVKEVPGSDELGDHLSEDKKNVFSKMFSS